MIFPTLHDEYPSLGESDVIVLMALLKTCFLRIPKGPWRFSRKIRKIITFANKRQESRLLRTPKPLVSLDNIRGKNKKYINSYEGDFTPSDSGCTTNTVVIYSIKYKKCNY